MSPTYTHATIIQPPNAATPIRVPHTSKHTALAYAEHARTFFSPGTEFRLVSLALADASAYQTNAPRPTLSDRIKKAASHHV